MKRTRGQALPEYALLMSLIALVCVASLTLLGDTLRQGLAKIFGDLDAAPGAVVAAAPTPSQSDASGETALAVEEVAAAAPASPAPSSQPVLVSYDPATGKIQFKGLDDASAAMNVTGSNGSKMAAAMLARLAALETLPDGTPMPDELKGLLERLAKGGHALATQEEKMDPTARRFSADPLVPYYTEFYDAFDAVGQALAKYPQLGDLTKQVNDYSGVIGSVAILEYYKKDPAFSRYGALLEGDITGTRIDQQGITVDFPIETTQQAANGIQAIKTP